MTPLPYYTQDDIQASRQRAVAALEQHGFALTDHDAYEPILQNRDRFVQLRRILKTPRFELVRIDAPTTRRELDMPTTPCRSCDSPIVWALHVTSGKRMPFDAGLSGDGRWRLVDGDDKGEPVKIAEFDNGLQFGHVSHFATCPKADQHRRQGR